MDTEGEAPGTKATAFATTLMLVENKSGYPVAYSAESKGGPGHTCLATATCKRSDHLGIGKGRLRCDNDVSTQDLVARTVPTMTTVCRKVVASTGTATSPLTSDASSPGFLASRDKVGWANARVGTLKYLSSIKVVFR